ncbi:hypothetical protein ESA94_09285 [Lacibacter luteus]|uniref:Uncharacterized protein n=1 Tax=Lacibacter luteus TaxID=2508719 RepID=A0A4Q1CJ28_9BACT|nr:hypothetical protein [Lacibacter luteus]RXK60646.1 hypothetical protein ESA94_09285 [Lacibacter luteus]
MLSRLQSISIFYAAALLLFTFYWAHYYPTYSGHTKGEELFTALVVFVFLTFFYFLVLQLTVERNNWALALFLPLINAIVTFLITVVVLWLGSLDGNPKEDILIFGVTYTLLSATAGLVLWNK